jgi:hypothetical protein
MSLEKLRYYLPKNSLWENDFSVWKVLQPVVRKAILYSLKTSGLLSDKKNSNIVIHFRCSDSPFNKHPSYHLLKFSWFKKAIKMALDYCKNSSPEIIILGCKKHHAHKDAYLCSDYIDELSKFIHDTFNMTSTQLCGDIDNDFATMFNAKVLAAKSWMVVGK